MKRRRGFSLIELLLAIFILGIGVIGIAALFPAGIIQQRQSVDDTLGPMVAENALAILRSKLSQQDFGTFEDFSPFPLLTYLRAPRYTIDGDWPWLRPGVVLEDDPNTNDVDERGMLDIFSFAHWAANPEASATEFPANSGYEDQFGTRSFPELGGIPFRKVLGVDQPPPAVSVTRQERYYPSASQYDNRARQPRPEFYWDCMFRRFNGRVLVAIFVYRITSTGEQVEWTMPVHPVVPEIPALPQKLDLTLADQVSTGEGPWDAWGPDQNFGLRGDNDIILGTDANEAYDPADPVQAWQEPGQWILDQNNNIHRVLAGGRYDTGDGVFVDDDAEDYAVQLLRPISQLAVGVDGFGYSTNPVFFTNLSPASGDVGVEDLVSDIWYMPVEIELDTSDPLNSPDSTVILTPVYLMVQEL